tara:strand:+ start:4200 stop:5333 length:1134 start_codon:yes stop_codon:yes gene_type:complete
MHKTNNKHTTLDNKHNEMIEKFKHNENTLIPKYYKDIEKFEKLLTKNSNKNKNKNKTDADDIEIKIKQIKNNIYLLEKEKREYFLNNSKYIFDYFEEKKNINNVNKPDTSDKNIYNSKINTFFNKDTDTNNDQINIERRNVIDKYFINIDRSYLNFDNYCYESDVCKFCNKGEIIYVESEGISICSVCSKSLKYLIENEKPSYKEPPKEVCFYAYKRINHLREILAQFQAKESTNIPDEVFENIKNQIRKERISINDLTNKKTKEILKNLGYNKYYEHIPFIKDKLGIKPPVMTPGLEETLCNLFMEIQKPYSKHCPKDRVNFLNYYYTLYKLCELLGETKFLPFFPMLKDREKRIEQDQIWKKISEELDWEFIPTV